MSNEVTFRFTCWSTASYFTESITKSFDLQSIEFTIKPIREEKKKKKPTPFDAEILILYQDPACP